MKKLIVTAALLSVLAASEASAQSRHGPGGPGREPERSSSHRGPHEAGRTSAGQARYKVAMMRYRESYQNAERMALHATQRGDRRGAAQWTRRAQAARAHPPSRDAFR